MNARTGRRRQDPQAQDRAAKAAALQRQQRAKERRQRLLLWGGISVLAAVVLAGLVVALTNRGGGTDAVQTYKEEAGHTESAVRYPQNPPAGGKHSEVLQNCGIYDQPVRNENAVHSLEHGAVWITYRPDLAASDVQRLRALVGKQTYLLLSRYPGLPAPVVASAWGKQERFGSAGDSGIAAFIRTYRQGPQTPEPGAACTGGTGTPIG